MAELKQVPMELINEPDIAARAGMDEGKLMELMESMRMFGLAQPILLLEKGERYEIIAGHRRWLAARELGWAEIKSIVHREGEMSKWAIRLHENTHREEMSAAEEALYFRDIAEALGLDEDGICKTVGRSREYVGDRWRLLKGDDDVFRACLERKITFAVARELNKVTDENMRRYFLHQARASEVSSRVVAQWVSDWKRDQAAIPPPPPADPSAPLPAAIVEHTVACCLCGGYKDPYNLKSVYIHGYELEKIQKAYNDGGE